MKLKYFVSALATILLTSCGQKTGSQAESEEEETIDDNNICLTSEQMKVANIELGTTELKNMNYGITANGQLSLRPSDKAEVSSLVNGLVRKLLVREGQQVTEGQVIAYIENVDIVAQEREYYKAIQERDLAQQELERQQTLNTQGAGIGKNLQEARAQLQVANATITAVGYQLQQMGISPKQVKEGRFVTQIPIKAEITGTVTRVRANIGSYVDMQSPLFEIKKNDAVHCDLMIYERDFNKVKTGQKAEIELTNQNTPKLKGTVSEISQYFDDETKSLIVHVHIDNTSKTRLIDGMYCTGTIYTGSQELEVLPNEAIVHVDGKPCIFVLNRTENNEEEQTYHFGKVEIETNVTDGDYTAFKTDRQLSQQQIVKKGAFYLASMIADHGEE